jgi:hypothetical protein
MTGVKRGLNPPIQIRSKNIPIYLKNIFGEKSFHIEYPPISKKKFWKIFQKIGVFIIKIIYYGKIYNYRRR